MGWNARPATGLYTRRHNSNHWEASGCYYQAELAVEADLGLRPRCRVMLRRGSYPCNKNKRPHRFNVLSLVSCCHMWTLVINVCPSRSFIHSKASFCCLGDATSWSWQTLRASPSSQKCPLQLQVWLASCFVCMVNWAGLLVIQHLCCSDGGRPAAISQLFAGKFISSIRGTKEKKQSFAVLVFPLLNTEELRPELSLPKRPH